MTCSHYFRPTLLPNAAHLALGIVWLALSQPVGAQIPAGVLDDLASDDYRVRHNATGLLLIDDQLILQDIADLYAQAHTPEQRHRLLMVARHHFIRQAREAAEPQKAKGSIGITPRAMTSRQLPELGRPAIRVIDTFPGFPGYAYFQPGDLILSVDDEPIPDADQADQPSQQFIAKIQSYDAGDEVRFAVWRNGETLLLTFRLATVELLSQMYQASNRQLRQPFLNQWLAFRDKMTIQASIGRPPAQPKPAGSDPTTSAPNDSQTMPDPGR